MPVVLSSESKLTFSSTSVWRQLMSIGKQHALCCSVIIIQSIYLARTVKALSSLWASDSFLCRGRQNILMISVGLHWKEPLTGWQRSVCFGRFHLSNNSIQWVLFSYVTYFLVQTEFDPFHWLSLPVQFYMESMFLQREEALLWLCLRQ